MFTTGSKLTIGLAVLASLSFGVYMVLIDPSSIGATALFGLVLALATLAGISLRGRDGEERAEDEVLATPSPGMWPVVAAFAAALLLVGTITSPIVFVLGIVAVLAAFVEWAVQAWSDRASADAAFNAAVRRRFMYPLELPILAAVGAAVVVVSFSQIMLAIDKSAGAILFIVVASLVLLAGILVAVRPGLKRGLVTGIAVLGAVGIVAGGVAGAGAGIREDLREAASHYERRACGEKRDKYTDKEELKTVSARSAVIATVTLRDGRLSVVEEGIGESAGPITVPRSNPSSILFRNADEGEFRLVARLGSEQVSEGVTRDIVECTQLIPKGAEQILTLTISKPSIAGTGYSLVVPGREGASIEVIVP